MHRPLAQWSRSWYLPGLPMRIAYFSPLPPSRSGIADYSAELLPALAEHLEVEAFIEDGLKVDPALAARFAVRGHRAFPALWEAGRYDAVLYQVGNNVDYHAGIYEMLLRYPGIVVLHEYVLHHLARGMTLVRNDMAGYIEEMRYAYGRTGQAMARRSLDTGIPLDVWTYPLFERVVDASLGVITHNDCTAQRVLASRPLTRIARVPHHLSLGEETGAPPPPRPAELRARLGIAPDAFVVASFGFITPAKRLDVSLKAFARLRREVPGAVYLLVGEVSPYYDFASLLTPELSQGVVQAGRVGIDEFLHLMRVPDVAINLRYPSAGETSGTLIRLLGLGVPVIVNNTGAFSEIPDDCCAKVDLDETEEELLLAYLRRLATNEALRLRMSENARRHVRTHHTLAGSARGYADFIRDAAAHPEPFRPAPPLLPYPATDTFTELVSDVTAEAVDLGGGEREEDFLRELAGILVDLGFDRADRGSELGR
ncbi:MAG TPA: glycosyltransferase family 4 protein, partial [Thermoanaerobaculia bacterium]|nr:glycosyltransferase family 4 protein [Thermoanaerobaculia bacterium]